MGWFAKKSQTRGAQVAELARPTDDPAGPATEDPAGPATEALAGVIRTLGQFAVELDQAEQADFPKRCEAWARHLLLGSPPPIGPELPVAGDNTPYLTKKAFADLRQFVTQRRKSEQSFLSENLGELRSTLIDLVSRLRRAAAEDSDGAAVMSDELRLLAQAVESQSFAELKAQVLHSVQVVGKQLDAQTQRRNDQLQSLGDQLRQMRTDLHRAQGEARRDPLTGLDNRMALDESLARYVALAEASGEALTAIMVDLDHFKLLNDSFGHQGGDEVLKAASKVLVRCYLRKCDMVCRYGGEEFCILLPSTASGEGARLTVRLLEVFRSTTVEHQGRKMSFTGSAGIAQLKDGESGLELLQRADEALYAAKRGGRDRVTVI